MKPRQVFEDKDSSSEVFPDSFLKSFKEGKNTLKLQVELRDEKRGTREGLLENAFRDEHLVLLGGRRAYKVEHDTIILNLSSELSNEENVALQKKLFGFPNKYPVGLGGIYHVSEIKSISVIGKSKMTPLYRRLN